MQPLYHSEQPVPDCGGIYKITCVPTGKLYVGSAVNIARRWRRHCNDLRNGTHDNPKLQRAYVKYGPDAFVCAVIELVLFPELLTFREQYWIDTLNPWFNIARVAGSNLGVKYSPESVEKSRVARTGMKRTPEQCERIGLPKRGMPSPNRGKKASPETLEKQRVAHLGKKQSDETIRKRTASLKGRERSPEAIEKTRLANLGRKNSPETIARMSIAKKNGKKRSPESYAKRRKTYIITDPFGTEYVVSHLSVFCEEHQLHYSHLIEVAKGKQRTHKGWQARYA